MALFGRKKEEKKEEASKDAKAIAVKKEEKKEGSELKKKAEDEKTEAVATKGTVSIGLQDRDLSSVIIRPLITEKAAALGESNVYTFEVRMDATKYDIRDAIKELFKVEPRKVNIVKRKPRKFISRMRNRRGIKPGAKKAYVYLKDGDRIDLI